MTELQLSEHLYPIDEVIGSFVQSILIGKPLDECLYWLWELLASTPDVDLGLITIYRQFYASGNNNVGRYISRKIRDFQKTSDKRCLADIVANLRTMKFTGTAYLISRFSEENTATVIYKKISWMKDYPPNSHLLLGALKNKDIRNIGWHAQIYCNRFGYDKTINVIRQYADSIHINIDDGIDKLFDSTDIISLAAILARVCDHPPWDVRQRFVRVPKVTVDNIESHFTSRSKQYWRKLTEKRLYSTHIIMPPGIYGRNTVNDLNYACSHCWEYYCYNSVNWNKRFVNVKAEQDHNKKEVVFLNDDILEEFYDDDNCMDFDEQPTSTQLMSLHDINIIKSPKDWLDTIKTTSLESNMSNMAI